VALTSTDGVLQFEFPDIRETDVDHPEGRVPSLRWCGASALNGVTGDRDMTGEAAVRRCPCGTRLARDNRGALCNACTKKARSHLVHPPAVPPDFWESPQMRAALDAEDMGALIVAFRTHPYHGKVIPQATVARWGGVTQSRLSAYENGEQITRLDKLIAWADALGVPPHLRWFQKPRASTRSAAQTTTPPAEHPSDQPAPAPNHVLLPVMVAGQQVLLPIDATAVERSGLGHLLDELATSGNPSGSSLSVATGWNLDQMSPLSRRSLLVQGLAAAAVPALGPGEAEHVAAALKDARRYLDDSVVDYFRRQLDRCKADDGDKGPAKTLPTVLTLLEVIQQHAREVKPDVYRQLLRVGAGGAEFAGWLYRDSKNPGLAGFWRDRATEWAQVAGDLPMQGYVLLKRAQAAFDDRDASGMLAFAQAAQTGPWQLPKRVRADVAQQEARGHAMLGDSNDLVQRKLDEAHQLLTEVTEDDGNQLGAHYNQTLLTMQTAICYTEAGQPRRAAELYDEWLSKNRFSKRDYGYFLSLRASALALAGEPDAAATIGLESLPLARATNSKRTTEELTKVLATLQPWGQRVAVRELREAVRSS
jgi:tetratricopeptide (TPR) repeat protein